MGQTLSEPVTTKDTSSCSNKLYKVGSSCMQGWRINMEDSHTEILSLKEDKGTAFFGVYDGHGGARVAQYCGRSIHTKITSHPSWAKGNIGEAIKGGFLACDTDMQKDDQMKDEMAGTTAIVIILKNNKIYCGNVGDSRAIASKKGAVEQLSFDHKPSNDDETRRIIAAGGWVEFNRVNGNLALSRALGDFCFKRNDKKSPEEQIVTALPDVIQKEITPDHEFIVLACDGIWDVLSNQEVIDFVRIRIAQKMEPEQICEELLTRCLAPDCQMGGLGCDNMTVIIVCLLQGGTYEDLCLKCSRPSDSSSAYNGNSAPFYS
ncbi:probable protein phosphatase 2C T23F11.1 [Pocillopora verrucosa]|uniref:protein-serine/threonine phosphatase n=1 Tax=Pocillopora meandrina TaxID=46732 RepID=A0AAU9WUK8_9CNID|nr:probable protein phosphatase 2C T23F11.1 [Pocillopora damicornis]XP_058955143.1 probable protein phosphatase 2C T23F11.1 [Pocillopora verrucosa]CAH3126033.1 unnamed protein product [Pocillopora meandrina]